MGGHADAQLWPAAPVDYTIAGGRFVPAIKAKTRRRVPVNVIT